MQGFFLQKNLAIITPNFPIFLVGNHSSDSCVGATNLVLAVKSKSIKIFIQLMLFIAFQFNRAKNPQQTTLIFLIKFHKLLFYFSANVEVTCGTCYSLGDVSNLLMCTVCGNHYHGLCVGLALQPGKLSSRLFSQSMTQHPSKFSSEQRSSKICFLLQKLSYLIESLL